LEGSRRFGAARSPGALAALGGENDITVRKLICWLVLRAVV